MDDNTNSGTGNNWCVHGPGCQIPGCRQHIFNVGRSMPARLERCRWKPKNSLLVTDHNNALKSRPCVECAEPFEAKRRDAKLCSAKCRARASRRGKVAA
jgi:hypothetical protein